MYVVGAPEIAKPNDSGELQLVDKDHINDSAAALLVKNVEFGDAVWRTASNQTLATERLDFYADEVIPLGMAKFE